MTKKFLVFIISMVYLCQTNAQEYRIQTKNPGSMRLVLIGFPNPIVEGYNGSDIVIQSEYIHNKPDKAKGLSPVYPKGIDNTGLGINVENNTDSIVIRYLLGVLNKTDYKIKIPRDLNLEVRNDCGMISEIHVNSLRNEIEVKTCKNLFLNDVSGPVVLSANSGGIRIHFSGLDKQRPSSISTIAGDVDLTFPEDAKVTVHLKSISGSIYSDFDFTMESDKTLKQIGGSEISGKLNGGGANFTVTNVIGNIYVRKGSKITIK